MNDLIFTSGYKPENTKYFVVHHFGGIGNDAYASSQNLSLSTINNAHGERWPGFYSQITNPITGTGYLVGYNGIIFPDKFVQTRAIGEETAAQKGYNFDGEAVSFCLAGNFTKKNRAGELVDKPTQFQLDCLKELKKKFPQVSAWNIVPHRSLGSTNCYGTGLADDWARTIAQASEVSIIENPDIMILKVKLSLFQQILTLISQIVDIKRRKNMGTFPMSSRGECFENARG